jgi:hypothetical protein
MPAAANDPAVVEAGGAQLGRCRHCRAVILWAWTAAGRAIPVDIEPVPVERRGCGKLLVELYTEWFPDGEPVDGVQRVRRRPPERPASSPGWFVHWATCSARGEALE